MNAVRADPDYFDLIPFPSGDPDVVVADAPATREWPQPEDLGTATVSDLGDVEYLGDLIRPGRILVVAAEEGTGKTYAINEIGIRFAVAGGAFAGTWQVVETGPVLVLSEMHRDDDVRYQDRVLAALDRQRSELTGRMYRLPLMTAALGRPALTTPAWRTWVTEWMQAHGVLLAIFDTATGATQVDPWGKAIQQVFADLRLMIDAYPDLAIVLLLHLKKPNGRGERRISDVLGEWGRWCDVVLLLERDGEGRTKLSTRKRVERERRIVATKRDGLLVDPVDLAETKATKVPLDAVVAAIAAEPGIDYNTLGTRLGVSKDSAINYVKQLSGRVDAAQTGPRRAFRLFLTAEPPNTVERASFVGRSTEDTE